ncbi:MAG: hypothetical protein FWF69_10620 [Firmicutes bacterium]|nr:hypothetical protein [Bacillota bacterium]
MDKLLYNAEIARAEYRRDLVDFREGISLTTKERDEPGEIIAPLLKRAIGSLPYAIERSRQLS